MSKYLYHEYLYSSFNITYLVKSNATRGEVFSNLTIAINILFAILIVFNIFDFLHY